MHTTFDNGEAFAAPPGSENWTLQDALDYAGPLPEDLGRATALASEAALARIWNSPEDRAAWDNAWTSPQN